MHGIEDYYPRRVLQHCPRCGAGGLAYHDNDSLSCSACGFVYFINAAAAVAGLICDADGRLLLVERANEPCKGGLDLPGGFVNILESAEDALKREIREELNIDIAAPRYFASFPNRYLYRGITYFTLDMGFICAIDAFDSLRPADDVRSFRFTSPTDIDLDEIAFDSIRRMLSLYRERHR